MKLAENQTETKRIFYFREFLYTMMHTKVRAGGGHIEAEAKANEA